MPISLGIEIEGIAIAVTEDNEQFPSDPEQQLQLICDIIRSSGLNARTQFSAISERSPSISQSWNVVEDATLMEVTSNSSASSGAFTERFGFELISPVMVHGSGKLWDREIRTCVAAIDGGITWAANRSTGFHVHIGNGIEKGFALNEVKNIAMLYCRFETSIDTLHPRHRVEDNDNIMPVRFNDALKDLALEAVLQKIMDARSVNEICALVNYDSSNQYNGNADSRFYKVNFTSLNKHGTIEFRQHEGTTDAQKMIEWV